MSIWPGEHVEDGAAGVTARPGRRGDDGGCGTPRETSFILRKRGGLQCREGDGDLSLPT